jgi:hypothetical protein
MDTVTTPIVAGAPIAMSLVPTANANKLLGDVVGLSTHGFAF